DEASGLGLVDVPSINRELPVNLTPNQPFLAQTVLLVALPKGDPDTGNLTMGEIHSTEKLYGLATGDGETKLSVFLTTAPVYRGNDGGAAITMDGRLAGMASLELTKKLGVAPNTAVIPASELEKVVERIVDQEVAATVSLGVRGQQVRVPELNRPGFYVIEVADASTAQRGGLQPTDIILSVDGQALQPTRTVDSYLTGKRAGDSVTVAVYRLNQILSFVMKIY
ncbi:MAG TPA: S1C family serine protease, partial [Thioalkalivibrio sp.]|nr:S1C family serine protease [Thioalkalivibrio sp.]